MSAFIVFCSSFHDPWWYTVRIVHEALTNDDDGRAICDGTCTAVLTVIYMAILVLIFAASYVGLVGFLCQCCSVWYGPAP